MRLGRGLGLFLLAAAPALGAQAPAATASPSGQGYDPRAAVQERMLTLVRKTALKDDSAWIQWLRWGANPAASAEAAAAGLRKDFRRLGLRVAREPGSATRVVADWSGRSIPGEIVLVSGHCNEGELRSLGAAAAVGMMNVYGKLRLKPRRTVRIVIDTAEAPPYAAARGTRHVALIDGEPGAGNPRGLQVRVTDQAMPVLGSFQRLTSEPGSTEVERGAPSSLARFGFPGLPAFGLLGANAGQSSAAPEKDQLRRQVASLATLAWWLGEMDAPLPELPAADAVN